MRRFLFFYFINLEKVISPLEDSEEDENAKILAGLTGMKHPLLDLSLDEYISLVLNDDDEDNL